MVFFYGFFTETLLIKKKKWLKPGLCSEIAMKEHTFYLY